MLSRTFTRREQAIMAGLAGAIVLGAGTIYLQRGWTDTAAIEPTLIPATSAAVVIEPRAPEPEPLPTAPMAPEPMTMVTVAVRGAVKYPGLYELAQGRRIDDLLDRAGGPTELADLRDINIAAPLLDGSTLTVPSFPDPKTGHYAANAYPIHAAQNPPQYTVTGFRPGVAPAGAANAESGGGGAGGLIDINRASQAELETLPGIGPVTAASIIAYREQLPFRAVEELEQVSGIGPKRLEAVRDLVTVSGQ